MATRGTSIGIRTRVKIKNFSVFVLFPFNFFEGKWGLLIPSAGK